MKSTFYLLIIIVTCAATFTSCNKNSDNPTPQQLDTLNAALPKQIIISSTTDSEGTTVTDNVVISFKYDTTNRMIQLYLDDTTNTNPYDVLAETYSYNSDGYLIGIKEADNGTDDQNLDQTYNVTFNRNADNNINYVAEVSKDGSWYDSIYYKYEPSNGETVITTVDHYYEGSPDLSGEDTLVYTYNSNHGLLQLADPSFQTNTLFTLNTNGTVQSYVTTTPAYNATVNYTYASGLPDGKADAFTQALLGKDYYLSDVLDFDPFVHSYNHGNDYDEAPVPYTNPYHISSANFKAVGINGNNNFTDNITDTWSYQLNAQNNVTQVVFNSSEGDNETIKFRY